MTKSKLAIKYKKGFSLVEVILAVALFSLFATALIGLLINSYGSNFQAEEKDKAVIYAEQGLDAARSIRRQAWNLLQNGDHGLDNSSGYWEFSGSSELIEDKYTRIIRVANICRDGNGDIVDCSDVGVTIDLNTKSITSTVTYQSINGVSNIVELVDYLTTWQSSDWSQTDWSGGSGQGVWSDIRSYDSDDGNLDETISGQVTLLSQSGSGRGTQTWTFDISGNYVVSDISKIEVIGGVAQLVESGGSSSCSGTPTTCTSYGDQTACEGQGGCSWGGGGSNYPNDEPSVNPIDSCTASGVASWSGFIETATKNGGEIYYQLSDDDGSTWKYWNGAAWSIAGASNYNIATEVDSNIGNFSTTTAKIMFKAFLSSNGSQQIQLDNVVISWGEGGGSGYAAASWLISSAFDMEGVSASSIISWSETLPAGTDIQVQLRAAPDNAGSPGTWSDWYGSEGIGTYFTENTGTIISSDLNFNQWLQYRVELSGDGSKTPILQDININYLP